jgi:hypothetical protein
MDAAHLDLGRVSQRDLVHDYFQLATIRIKNAQSNDRVRADKNDRSIFDQIVWAVPSFFLLGLGIYLGAYSSSRRDLRGVLCFISCPL